MIATGTRVRARLALACALASGLAMAEDVPRAGSGAWAAGLSNGYVIMERQSASILVTERDVANGMVNVPDGSRIIVVTSSPGDYAVEFSARAAMFRSVRIEGVGRTVEVGGNGGTVVSRAAPSGRRVISINYLFFLAPDAVPGTYAWPLQLAVRGAGPSEPDLSGAIAPLATMCGSARP